MIISTLYSFVLVFLFVHFASVANGIEGLTAHIGIYLPVTHHIENQSAQNGSRISFHSGNQVVAASIISILHANERYGGIVPELNGTIMAACPLNFTFSVHDTQGLADIPILELVNSETNGRHPDVVIGPSIPHIAEAFSIVSRAYSVPVISPSVGLVSLDNKQKHPFFFRTHPSDKDSAHALVEYLHEIHVPHVAIAYDENDVFAVSYKNELAAECRLFNITLYPFPILDDNESLELAVKEIVSHKLNVVITVTENIEFFLRAADQADWVGEGRLYIFTENTSEHRIVSAAENNPSLGKLLSGTIRISPLGGVTGRQQYDNLVQEWPSYEQYREAIDSHFPGGLSSLDTEIDHTRFQLEGVVFETLDTDIASYAYDAGVTAVLSLCAAHAADAEANAKSNTESILEAITDEGFTFQGVSGELEFDAKGSRKSDSVTKVLENFIYDENTDTINFGVSAHWDSSQDQWNYDGGNLFYAPGNVLIPPRFTDVVEGNHHYIQTWEIVFIATLGALVYALAVMIGIWIYIHRRRSVLIASQPIFLFTIVVGVLVSTSSVFFEAYDENLGYSDEELDAACMLPQWLWSLGTTLTTGSLIVKLYRINKVFKSNRFKVVVVSSSDMLKLLIFILSINVVLLSLWQIFAPWKWERTVAEYDIFGQEVETFGRCQTASGTDATPYIVILLCFHGILYGYGGYLSYITRNIPTDFQEGKWISLSFMCEVQLLLLGVPVIAAVRNDPAVQFLVVSGLICLMNIALLILIFLPKALRVAHGTEVELHSSDKGWSRNNKTSTKAFTSLNSAKVSQSKTKFESAVSMEETDEKNNSAQGLSI